MESFDASAPSLTILRLNRSISFPRGKRKTFLESQDSIAQAFKKQNFYEILDELYEKGSLFEDPEFPASEESLFIKQIPKKKIEWKRPYVFLIYSSSKMN